jgi:hypothetical protein
MMGGYGDRKEPSAGIHDPLYGQVLVFSNGSERICFIVLDLLTVDSDFSAELRSEIQSAIHVPANNVQIVCTHTHGGPMGFRPLHSDAISDEVRRQIDFLREKVQNQLIEAAKQADQNQKEVYIEFGHTQVSGIATNRLDPNGPMDDTISTLVVRQVNQPEIPLAIVVNFTCHPTVLNYKNLLFSSDYPHYVRACLRKKLNASVPVLFTNGACGDVSTRFTRQGADFDEAKRIGYLVGEGAYEAITNKPNQLKSHLMVKKFKIDMPVKQLPSLKEAQDEYQRTLKAVENLDRKTAGEGEIRLVETEFHGARANLKLVEYGYLQNTEAEVNIISFDEIAFVTIPGELFVALGLEIKQKSPFQKTIILGYANDALGYIPSKEAYQGTGYEARRTQFAEGAGEFLVDQIVKQLDTLKEHYST